MVQESQNKHFLLLEVSGNDTRFEVPLEVSWTAILS